MKQPKFIPILFSAPMVEVIIEGKKTQTRRTVKIPKEVIDELADDPDTDFELTRMQDGYPDGTRPVFLFDDEPNAFSVPNRYGNPGDVLWVRETWSLYSWDDHGGVIGIKFKDGTVIEFEPPHDDPTISDWLDNKIHKLLEKGRLVVKGEQLRLTGETLWEPSIFMPKWVCRLFLRVKSVKVERLQDMNRGDAMAEGCPFPNMKDLVSPIDWFTDLWGSINGTESWKANPFVWVIEFEKIDKPDNFI